MAIVARDEGALGPPSIKRQRQGALLPMPKPVRIAIDAMGGDHGPSVVVPGAAIALERHPESKIVLVGDEASIAPFLNRHPGLKAATTVVHTDVAVRMDDKPSQALRQGRRRSSMWLMLDAVRHGQADVAVSAGNTGALMAMAKFCLKTMPGIDRPAIAAIWPNLRGESVVLDLGASIGADAKHLVDMAVMGAAMARIVFDLERPTVGLLNIGVEEIKGIEEVREAGRILREANLQELDYRGFVEGDDIGKGTVDVVVTEGFTGNIALEDGGRHGAPDRRISARRVEPHLARTHRLSARARGLQRDPRKSRSEESERRRFTGAERRRGEEPWRRRRRKLRVRNRHRL